MTHIKINTEPENDPEITPADRETAPQEAASPEESLESRLAAKEKEAQEHYDRWLRATAEFENVKKRLEKEKSDTYKFANESLIKELLPVLDNLERALNHGGQDQDLQALVEGLEMTLKGFLSALEKFGVTAVDARGKAFDPTVHEAVMVQEDPATPGGTVLNQLQKGYLLHNRLIRPAMVVVSKKPETGEEESGPG